MQKRKIEDNKIWDAYKSIMVGESLTAVANSVDINRGTLKRYIEAVVIPNLNIDERKAFEQKINQNFRGNSTEQKREAGRKKKEKAIRDLNEGTKEKLQSLTIDSEKFATLYNLLASNKHTLCAKDTYIHKLIEHITYLTSIGFTTDEIFDFFIHRPRAFGADTKSIKAKYDYLVVKKGSSELALEALKSNPGFISKKTPNLTTSTPENTGGGER